MTNKNKITKLTPEQEAQIPIYLEKTLKEGYSTERCDRGEAEKWICELYKERGLTPPKNFHWGRSPKEIALMHQKLSGCETPQIPTMRGGQELAWLGFFGFLTEVLGLEWDGDLTPHLEVARRVGWWMPFENDCFVSERPTSLKFDAENNLHCEDGPAFEFSDGYQGYFWHGTAVPGEWIEDPDNVDPSLALTWENVEERRCLAEIVGWEKVLSKLDTKVIDEDPDPLIGTLLEADLPDSPGSRFLKVQCGTGRNFVLPVPETTSTALEANTLTYPLLGELNLSVADFEFRT